jgi:hypothetical protein
MFFARGSPQRAGSRDVQITCELEGGDLPIDAIDITYSLDRGQTWVTAPMALGQHHWSAKLKGVPLGTSILYSLRIFDEGGETVEDNGGQFFTYAVEADEPPRQASLMSALSQEGSEETDDTTHFEHESSGEDDLSEAATALPELFDVLGVAGGPKGPIPFSSPEPVPTAATGDAFATEILEDGDAGPTVMEIPDAPNEPIPLAPDIQPLKPRPPIKGRGSTLISQLSRPKAPVKASKPQVSAEVTESGFLAEALSQFAQKTSPEGKHTTMSKTRASQQRDQVFVESLIAARTERMKAPGSTHSPAGNQVVSSGTPRSPEEERKAQVLKKLLEIRQRKTEFEGQRAPESPSVPVTRPESTRAGKPKMGSAASVAPGVATSQKPEATAVTPTGSPVGPTLKEPMPIVAISPFMPTDTSPPPTASPSKKAKKRDPGHRKCEQCRGSVEKTWRVCPICGQRP